MRRNVALIVGTVAFDPVIRKLLRRSNVPTFSSTSTSHRSLASFSAYRKGGRCGVCAPWFAPISTAHRSPSRSIRPLRDNRGGQTRIAIDRIPKVIVGDPAVRATPDRTTHLPFVRSFGRYPPDAIRRAARAAFPGRPGHPSSRRWETPRRTLSASHPQRSEGSPVKGLWRLAGALCIAHPVLLLAGYSQ